MDKLGQYLRLIRVKSWIKNLFVFVPLIFSKNLFDPVSVSHSIMAFLAFSLASGFVYVINDYFDAEYDRLHPVKKYRPIAYGKVTGREAVIIAAALIILSIVILNEVSARFKYIIAAYIVINFLYTLYLKNLVILDVMIIAFGFLLRVAGGAVVINVELSGWLMLATIFIALFMAVIKRRVEYAAFENNSQKRKVLFDYSIELLNLLTAVSGGGIIISYALYSISEHTMREFDTEYLVYTVLFVIYGVFRYLYLAIKQNRGEDPAELVLSDIPTILNAILYILCVLLIIYG
ncbi:phosphoribose diphosphate:decaprenyl-phosphate phosphoribosyltransferase [Melioribacter roseus P3M-2]|uniref:Phosphoribose diphosphate:decaprenyl-phosphate phosphoribosyltransferase n=1 Tax=Melioribacter roseus (strain DSM 23840 / JCM 17771 / VKM B-2668 / P3M-2) TaxID=1191523 RepID=I6YZH2_MELRP|nr:decaprenyl-phosphate phosphoribosyltransferase [Melioribacter roseus]AFN75952.1 phosphoribose diphosphate:decaprenyl-phosphate phosphoribosyltransferase [Melioribacter roseus P3M-2]